MSAIWGTITLKEPLPLHTENLMCSYYKENCKIDRIESIFHTNTCFGCGIQYITKESLNEQLPYYHNEQEVYFTADCILDNRKELLNLLNESDTSTPDGSLILLAYQKWGINCVKHLRGLFSFVVYEKLKNTIYLVADQISSRCLYYYCTQDSITFSTLLTPIHQLHSEIVKNEYYIKDFLTAPGLMPNILSNETPLQHVYKINPGTYLEIKWNATQVPSTVEHTYWTPAMSSPIHKCKTPAQYGKAFRKLYEECVQDALRTNGNVGISMSSGLDSASVGALAATHLQKTNQSLYTYTYVPFEKPEYDRNPNHIHDETKDVEKIIAMHPNMIPHFVNTQGKNCFESIPRGMKIMEIPYKAFGNLPSLFEIYENAANNCCKIVLTGQMGNSTVSHGYIDDVLYDIYAKKKYISFLCYLNHYSKTVKESRKEALKGCIRYFNHTNREYQDTEFHYIPSNPYLADNITENYPLKERYLSSPILFKGNIPTPEVIYRQQLYMKAALTYLGELDTKAGLAHGIVLRDPTRDMRMLSFCYHLPYHLFAYKGVPRWLIRSQLRDVLPTELLDHWMRYGVQNSDFLQRLARDWKQIYPRLQQSLHSSELEAYVNPDHIKQFFEENKSSLPSDREMEITYLLIFYVLYNFFLQFC